MMNRSSNQEIIYFLKNDFYVPIVSAMSLICSRRLSRTILCYGRLGQILVFSNVFHDPNCLNTAAHLLPVVNYEKGSRQTDSNPVLYAEAYCISNERISSRYNIRFFPVEAQKTVEYF